MLFWKCFLAVRFDIFSDRDRIMHLYIFYVKQMNVLSLSHLNSSIFDAIIRNFIMLWNSTGMLILHRVPSWNCMQSWKKLKLLWPLGVERSLETSLSKKVTIEDIIQVKEAQLEVNPSPKNGAQLSKAEADLKRYLNLEEES